MLMIYSKSIAVGIAAVAAFTILGLLIPVTAILSGGYGGFDFAPSLGGSVILLLIFAVGFYWEFRRLLKRQRSS